MDRPIFYILSKSIILFIVLVLLVGTPSWGNPLPLKITFINPGISDANDPTGGFWLRVSAFMRAAANDLHVDLEILYAQRNHILMVQQALNVVSRPKPPDYLIVVNEKLAAAEIIKAADKARVKVFLLLNRFRGQQALKMGEPRQKYRYWIGSLIPDNHFAGRRLAEMLIDQAQPSNRSVKKHPYQMIAIAGDYATQASIERIKGLEQAISDQSSTILKQIFYGHWRKDEAHYLTQHFLRRYPKTRIIWAANDPMAIGAMEAAIEMGRHPGKDIFIGGLNWDPPALDLIQKNLLVTSLGGHFMAGGWAIVVLYDYDHGIDFKQEGLQLKMRIFGTLNKANIDRYLNRFDDRNWDKIDFTRFSKRKNPKIVNYSFSASSVME